MRIKQRVISEKRPPFIVAEISANHNNNLNRALKLVYEAKKAGADAVKLQTYKANTITLKSKNKEFLINDKKSIWHGKYLYDLYKQGSTPWGWHKKIFDYAKKNKIICFSSPFDEEAVDFLDKLNCPAFKIASFENNHFPLMKKIISKKKPAIISTGASKLQDIRNIVNFFKRKKFKNFALLKCTSSYPSSATESNLKTISDLRKKFNIEVGLSDHTPGIGAAIIAIAYGATIIEKHFTLSRKGGGLDDSFSIEPNELSLLVEESRRAWLSKGKTFYGITKSEKKSLIFKRSIFTTKNIKKGEIFSKENISIVRPGFGTSPINFKKFIGKKALTNIKKAKPLKLSYLKR